VTTAALAAVGWFGHATHWTFGFEAHDTGHHATTRQMISMMRELPVAGSRVFDFGTGTGVLAILAAKMGAKEVEAIDIDEWSINNAAENFSANQCEQIFLHLSDNLNGIEPAEIVLAKFAARGVRGIRTFCRSGGAGFVCCECRLGVFKGRVCQLIALS
jgi:ribosomal protein L11 methylase PrmA